MKNNIYVIFVLIILFSACHSTETTIIAKQPEDTTVETWKVDNILASNKNVKIGTMQTKLIDQKIICTGKIEIPASKRVSIHSKSEGYIHDMKYTSGDYVKKGALLFSVTNPKLIEQQRILLETKAKLSLAEKDYERKKILESEQATSQKTFDEVYMQKELLTAQYQGLKSELRLIGVSIDALEKTHKFQSEIFIYAPQTGVLSEILVNKGQMISPETKLAELTNNADAYVELQAHPKDIGFLERGQKVEFYVPNSAMVFGATIDKLNPALNSAGTLTVYCSIDKTNKNVLKAGTFVNAHVEVKAQKAKGVPIDATVKESEVYFGYFVEGDSLVKKQLENAQVIADFVIFDQPSSAQQMVIEGAYYIE